MSVQYFLSTHSNVNQCARGVNAYLINVFREGGEALWFLRGDPRLKLSYFEFNFFDTLSKQ